MSGQQNIMSIQFWPDAILSLAEQQDVHMQCSKGTISASCVPPRPSICWLVETDLAAFLPYAGQGHKVWWTCRTVASITYALRVQAHILPLQQSSRVPYPELHETWQTDFSDVQEQTRCFNNILTAHHSATNPSGHATSKARSIKEHT